MVWGTSTISNTLHCNGLKVPMLKKAHLNDSQKAWNKVLWSKETKIELHGRKRNADHDPENTIPAVKHGGGNYMLWTVQLLKVKDDFTDQLQKTWYCCAFQQWFLHQIQRYVWLEDQIIIFPTVSLISPAENQTWRFVLPAQ